MNLFKIWLSIFLLGLFFFPITSVVFKNYKDRGWIFSKIIGLVISSLLMWLLSSLKILKYTLLNSYLIIFFFILINGVFLFIRIKNNKISLKKINLSIVKNIIITEIAFTACLCLWSYIKGFNSNINSSVEQFMDYGYMNSIMNSINMPPEDIWLSGNSINYYYFGQYVFGFLSKISNLTASESYFYVIAFIATCSFMLPAIISYNLLCYKLKNKNKFLCNLFPIIVSFFIGFSITFGGTLHYPIYKWFPENTANYSYINEVRFIGQNSTEDSTATEVPAYSSIIGDLHAHYIDLVFSLTTIALLVQFSLYSYDNKFKNYRFYLNLLFISIMLSVQKMTNFWDFPIYIVIIGAIVIAKNLVCDRISKKNVLATILTLVGIALVEELLTLPFTLNLTVNSTNICFTNKTTPFYKFIIKWGYQIIAVSAFTIIYYYKFKKQKSELKDFLNNHLSDFFVIIIGFCAIGLIIIPEIIYIKDIYGEKYHRFNTMFKLTYQAYILISICVGYVISNLILSKNKYVFFIGANLFILFTSTLGYGVDTILTNYKNVENKGISTYSTESYLKSSLPKDYEAIQWIKKNLNKNDVILEACDLYYSSYSLYSRVSTFTGNPTVLGWANHEWIWRYEKDYSRPEEITNRNNDVELIYTTTDSSIATNLLRKYNIKYIYIGEMEYKKYENINVDLLKGLGEVVYSNNNIYLIKVFD